MDNKEQGKISIEKLVALIRKLNPGKPDLREADYSRWDQTEEEYQQEQAQWLARVRGKNRYRNKK